jgi:hypothetical protein
LDSQNVVRRQRPPDIFQRELAHRLDLHGILDLRQHPRTGQDLPGLGFIAKPRGNIGYRANGGIIEAALEADGAERGKPVWNADAKANVAKPGLARLKDEKLDEPFFAGRHQGTTGT